MEKLSDVTINYGKENPSYIIEKLKFSKVKDDSGKKVDDKTIVIFNNDIKVSNIPLKAYNFVVNGRHQLNGL